MVLSNPTVRLESWPINSPNISLPSNYDCLNEASESLGHTKFSLSHACLPSITVKDLFDGNYESELSGSLSLSLSTRIASTILSKELSWETGLQLKVHSCSHVLSPGNWPAGQGGPDSGAQGLSDVEEGDFGS